MNIKGEDSCSAAVFISTIDSDVALTLQNCQFIQTNCQNGAIFFDGSSASSVQITGCTFDSYQTTLYACLRITFPLAFNFSENAFQNMNLESNCYTECIISNSNDSIEFDHITFNAITSSPEIFGGSALTVQSVKSIIFHYCGCTKCTQNNEDGNGGAVQMWMKEYLIDVEFNHLQFFSNVCQRKGGALVIQTLQKTTISNCKYPDNHATKYGGALYFNLENNEGIKTSDSLQISITNCEFKYNVALDGYAIFVDKHIGAGYYTLSENIYILPN